MAYQTLAALYDSLMQDVDYNRWTQYLQQLLQDNACPGKRLLDLGCGTGNITLRLADAGYEMTGVDLSAEMLEQAMEKPNASAVKWICQDIGDMDLDVEVAAVLATFDVINHLTEAEQVQQCFMQIGEMLQDNGLLIFDVHTANYLRNYLGDNIYSYHSDAVDYVWENTYDWEEDICHMQLTYYIRQENGLYQKLSESQEEKYYDLDLLRLWLDFSGFEVLDIYGALTTNALTETDNRAVFVARKRTWEDDWDEDSIF